MRIIIFSNDISTELKYESPCINTRGSIGIIKKGKPKKFKDKYGFIKKHLGLKPANVTRMILNIEGVQSIFWDQSGITISKRVNSDTDRIKHEVKDVLFKFYGELKISPKPIIFHAG
jgi:hypothetical protein